jgi:transposase
MRAYSQDLRERIVKAVESGKTKSETARLFGVSLPTVKRYLGLKRHTGHLTPRPIAGRPRAIQPQQHLDLIAQLQAHPDATLEEHCQVWLQSHQQRLSLSTMHRAIARAGFTLKKRR